MATTNTFREVVDILKIHGHEIMMAFYGNEEKCNLQRDFTPEEWETEQHNLMFYSCYEGAEFLPMLFGLQDYNRDAFFEKTPVQTESAMKKGYIYHCKVNTYNETREYGSTQVHYFTVYVSDVVVLFQTYGGTDGILVKYVHNDINDILDEIIAGSGESYKRLFEIPKHMHHALSFDFVDLQYVRQPLFTPNLEHLDKLLKTKGLEFAADKIAYYI